MKDSLNAKFREKKPLLYIVNGIDLYAHLNFKSQKCPNILYIIIYKWKVFYQKDLQKSKLNFLTWYNGRWGISHYYTVVVLPVSASS